MQCFKGFVVFITTTTIITANTFTKIENKRENITKTKCQSNIFVTSTVEKRVRTRQVGKRVKHLHAKF